jgi:sec-independent protein translocase protein TatA
MFSGIGFTELLVIFLVVLILFGARRIPDIAQGLGKGIREFKKAVREVQGDVDATEGSKAKPGRIENNSGDKS